jgi:hypothetical protein
LFFCCINNNVLVVFENVVQLIGIEVLNFSVDNNKIPFF